MNADPNDVATNDRATLTKWRELHESSLATMTPAERAEHDAAAVEADIALDLAQQIYDARTHAGLSQTELAHCAGTTQTTISQLEGGGGELPALTTIARIARATGRGLQLSIPPAAQQ